MDVRNLVTVVVVVLVVVQDSNQIPVQIIPENEIMVTEEPVFTYEIDPLENIGVELSDGELIEGDIRLLYKSYPEPNNEMSRGAATLASGASLRTNSHQARNSISEEMTWLDKVIPYEIDPAFNSSELQTILSAIQNLTASVQNCIEFVPRQNQEDFIYISGQLVGCWSDIGKKGGNQSVLISRRSGCVQEGIIMHELMHVLGFWHEHTRPDRDQYIKVINNHIRIDHLNDFRINPNGKMLVSEYDYYSIMHYKTNQFSKVYSSLKTIQILQSGIDETKVGQREGLSKYDVERVLRLYGCQKQQRSVDSEPTAAAKKVSEPKVTHSSNVPTEKGQGLEVIVRTMNSPTPSVSYQTQTVEQNIHQMAEGNITETLPQRPDGEEVGR